MKTKPVAFFFVLICLIYPVFGEGIDRLAGTIADAVGESLKDAFQKKASIIRFENFSELTDQSAVKFYQIVVSRLERQTGVQFIDLMINFNNGQGEFNESAAGDISYPIYLKLIRNMDKIGVGAVVFSRIQDRIIALKYTEETVPKGEREILDVQQYGFMELGFARVIEIDAEPQLLDFRTITDLQGEERFYFLYPDKIEVFGIIQNRLTKLLSVDLDWERPYYPAIKPEGKLFVAYHNNEGYLAVGTNFAPLSKMFRFEELQWQELDGTDFTPIRLVDINQETYFLGARYEMGKNYFQDKIVLAPFADGKVQTQRQYEKQISFHYSIDFSTRDNQLNSVHLVDLDYNYRFLGADFEIATTDVARRGSSLAALDGQWIAVSAYTEAPGSDKLFFYKIDNSARQLVYEKSVDGSARFLTNGTWKSMEGFWVYLEKPMPYRSEYKLQFWQKNEPAQPQSPASGKEGGE